MKVWYNDNNYCDAYAPCTQKGRIHDKSKKKHALYRLSAGSFHAGSCFLSAGFGGQRIIEHIHDPGHEHDRYNPRGATVLSVDTPAGDAAWSKAGILDASEKIKEMQKNGTTAEIIAANGDTIAVAEKSSDYANSVFNLNNLDEKGKKDFLKYMEPSSMDGSTTGTITWYDHAQIPFFMIDICAENIKEEGPVYERSMVRCTTARLFRLTSSAIRNKSRRRRTHSCAPWSIPPSSLPLRKHLRSKTV